MGEEAGVIRNCLYRLFPENGKSMKINSLRALSKAFLNKEGTANFSKIEICRSIRLLHSIWNAFGKLPNEISAKEIRNVDIPNFEDALKLGRAVCLFMKALLTESVRKNGEFKLHACHNREVVITIIDHKLAVVVKEGRAIGGAIWKF